MTSSPNSTVFLHAPSERLRPWIRRFTLVEYGSACQDFHLPDIGLVAAFRYRGDLSLDGDAQAPWAILTGLQDTIRAHHHGGKSGILVAAFTPLGAAAFFRQSLNEFFDRATDLRDILPRSTGIRDVSGQLSEAPDVDARILIVERLLSRCLWNPTPDPVVAQAVSWIQNGQTELPIAEVAAQLGLSQSALERRFKRVVGTSPKRFASLVRLQKVVGLRAKGQNLSTIAHTAGYFDQSHFIKDFRRIAGQAPAAYFARTPLAKNAEFLQSR